MFGYSTSQRPRTDRYVFSLFVAAFVVRLLVGLAVPQMTSAQSALVGLMTVMLVAPSAYRYFHGRDLLTGRKVPYGVLASLTVGFFLFTLHG